MQRYNLTDDQCTAYISVYDVINSTRPRTALVRVENYKLIVPCMIYLLENRGYHVVVSNTYMYSHNVVVMSQGDRAKEQSSLIGLCQTF